MSPPALAFSDLKRSVSIATVLTAEGLATSLKRRGQRLVGPCPVHGGDNPQAFVVDLDRDLWYCFTRCQGGGDVVELAHTLWSCACRNDTWLYVIPHHLVHKHQVSL